MQSSKDKITQRGVVGMLNDRTSCVVDKTNDKLMTVEIPHKLNMPIKTGVKRVQQIAQGCEEDFRGKLNHFKSQSGWLISKSLIIKKPRFSHKSYDDMKLKKPDLPKTNSEENVKTKGKDRHNLIKTWQRAGKRAATTGGEQKRWHAIANYKNMMKTKLECASP